MGDYGWAGACGAICGKVAGIIDQDYSGIEAADCQPVARGTECFSVGIYQMKSM